MIKIENYNNLESSGISYGGHSGSKKGVIINNEKWFLKYPKSTKSMENVNISYTTMPLSEYLGSHIYKIFGLDVHETKLGVANSKLVVACKDFLSSNEIILDYNSIKNEFDETTEKELESLSTTSFRGESLEELILILENNPIFKRNKELIVRFYDMFIIDTFITNNDRNEGNWGLILNKDNGNIRIAPVYDNGASFYNKTSEEKLKKIINDEKSLIDVAYHSSITNFTLNGKVFNPIKYIESKVNKDLNEALIRVFPKIDMDKIKELFESIPEEYNGISVFPKVTKEAYYKILEYRYNLFKQIYEELKSI